MCGKSLLAEEDDRYVVKIEIYAACDSMEVDDDEDLINDFEEEDDDEDDEEDEAENLDPDETDSVEYKTFRYDLCSKCHSLYLQEPLSIKSIRRGRFSEN
jgi:hypothetical protein